VSIKEIHQSPGTKPRFFYGYIVVGLAFFIMAVSWAIYNSFGVFLKPLLTEFGWTSAVTSGAFSLSMIIYGVLGVVTGGLADRFGPRVVLTICGFLAGLGYFLMSLVNTPWQLYLFYGVIVGIGMGGVWVPLLSCTARWFVRRRNLMTGVVIGGAGIGSLIGPMVISRMIALYDWRRSFVILGGVALLAVVIAAQFLKRDPAQMRQSPYGGNEEGQPGLVSGADHFSLKEAISTVPFWLTFLMFFSYGFGFFSFLVHIVPHAIDLGIPAISAANILAISGGTSILGNYGLGSAGDRIGPRQIFFIGCLIEAAVLFSLVPAREAWMLFLISGVFGFAAGGLGASESPLVAVLFGMSSHGLIYGVVHLGFTVGAALGPFMTGYIFDLTGGYQVAFLVSAIIGIVAVILTVLIRPTKRLGGRI
jgi:MFS family permease